MRVNQVYPNFYIGESPNFYNLYIKKRLSHKEKAQPYKNIITNEIPNSGFH